MNKLYEEHKKTIRAVAIGITRKTGIPFDELESEANMIFVTCADRHPDAIHFDRYLKKSLNWGMYKYVRKQAKNEFEGIAELDHKFVSYDKVCDITLEDVSRDAKKVMELVFDKKHISQDTTLARPRLYKKHIFAHLKNRGWKERRIHRSFDEITTLVELYQMN